MRKVNLGCGRDFRQGYENYDNYSCNLSTISHAREIKKLDLNQFPWPFEDSSIDEVLMVQVMEHLPDTYKVVSEVQRILAPGGLFNGAVPYAFSFSGMNHPQHYRHFTKASFDHLAEDFGFTIERVWCSTLGIRRIIPFKSVLSVFLNNIYDDVNFKLRKK